ncbi:GDP-L-fucose synthase [Halomonas titanicae]|uniref:GDP-L-fucose synthase family protein n=1 Tax=Vreelandella titanicae TaxID=664683 RepID=UPI001F3A37E3|nr:GDP-L-fucose synthase [Halomonas titanicae]MCE7520570.1 GDP-L-fucose synthase [Halomonas titanicae]
MKILLTGSSGMVGKNILEHPDAQNHEFLTPGSKELNLLDLQSVRAFFAAHKPDCVIHAAGRVGGIQANMANPVGFLVDNTLMGVHVINSAHEAGVKHLINLASSCMFPRSAANPLQESDILKGELEPTNEGYALAKITATRLCEYISRTDPEAQFCTLIPCNLYGRYDKFDPDNSHMIPAVIRKIYEAKVSDSQQVEIWGDGEARREFMYAEDLADFIFISLTSMAKQLPLPELINVGLGQDYSINEYYRAIADVIGYQGEFVHDLNRPVGMRQKLIDSSIANSQGWKADTTLVEGIEKTYRYFVEDVLND